jgi:histidine triad (HIT) family protein
MGECIFCKIIKGEIPSKKVYEDDVIFAFDDINPQAPVHTLVVPKQHIPTLNDMEDDKIWSAMLKGAKEIARIKGVSEKGYRIVVNCGKDGGQIVMHLHLHVLGGKRLDDKMG